MMEQPQAKKVKSDPTASHRVLELLSDLERQRAAAKTLLPPVFSNPSSHFEIHQLSASFEPETDKDIVRK